MFIRMIVHVKSNDQSFFDEVHEWAAGLVQQGLISHDTRVVFGGVWSDGFQAHRVTGHTELNQVQFFTVRFKGKPDQRTPFALAFTKQTDGSLIAIKMIQEFNELKNVKMRYWGAEKELHPTIVVFEMLMQDLPERCKVNGMSYNGTYSKRWGYSCRYNHSKTPSCKRCLQARIELLNDERCDFANIPECQDCSDWWAPCNEDEDFADPGFEIFNNNQEDGLEVTPPCIKLTFQKLKSGLKQVYDWSLAHDRETGATTVLEKYLQMICLGDPKNNSS